MKLISMPLPDSHAADHARQAGCTIDGFGILCDENQYQNFIKLHGAASDHDHNQHAQSAMAANQPNKIKKGKTMRPRMITDEEIAAITTLISYAENTGSEVYSDKDIFHALEGAYRSGSATRAKDVDTQWMIDIITKTKEILSGMFDRQELECQQVNTMEPIAIKEEDIQVPTVEKEELQSLLERSMTQFSNLMEVIHTQEDKIDALESLVMANDAAEIEPTPKKFVCPAAPQSLKQWARDVLIEALSIDEDEAWSLLIEAQGAMNASNVYLGYVDIAESRGLNIEDLVTYAVENHQSLMHPVERGTNQLPF